jgi:hypothetical protein
MIKVTIIKFGKSAVDALPRLLEGYSVASVCDPDLAGTNLAQYFLKGITCYADPSLAIRGGCDAVVITISDRAPQIALLALAYHKRVLLLRGVSMGDYDEKILSIAKLAGLSIGRDV